VLGPWFDTPAQRELENEVMELRAKVQVQEIALNVYKQATDELLKQLELLASDRDRYKREAEFWERNCTPDE
jgi:hypothetical protein